MCKYVEFCTLIAYILCRAAELIRMIRRVGVFYFHLLQRLTKRNCILVYPLHSFRGVQVRMRGNICVKWKIVFLNVQIIILVNSDQRLARPTCINTPHWYSQSFCFYCSLKPLTSLLLLLLLLLVIYYYYYYYY